jgi:23S rRNA (cytosine1962-C5)-methyltransferase
VSPCILFEDEHLLVVNKPAGVNTHAPSPFAGEGIYDWLRQREPRWASLAILHRLDKETSGVMVFGKSPLANRSLTEQFTAREVHKKYLLLTDRPVKQREFTVKSEIRRVGERYASGAGGESAETHFRVLECLENSGNPPLTPPRRGTGHRLANAADDVMRPKHSNAIPSREGAGVGSPASQFTLLQAEPHSGRTHQIRVHASESGFPILGDTLYGGTAAERVHLHAAELRFKHPETGAACAFSAEADFSTDRRGPLIDSAETNAFRLLHGASDGWPGWHVERLGDYLLSQSEHPLTSAQHARLAELLKQSGRQGAYHKILNRQVRRTSTADASPDLILGRGAPERFEIRENGVRYEMSFAEGYSVGLFLDQRDNRRRFLTHHIAANFPLLPPQPPAARPELLNCFAYTCGFSVCAALSGIRTTSLDLSKKYLEWGRRNFVLNGLDPAQHDFIYGDTFDWLRRLAKKQRAFDVVVLDPPTFSQSKETGVFRAEKDYGRLVTATLPVLKPDGVLLASTNAAEWPPEAFVETLHAAVRSSSRRIAQEHFVPQPMDFPISKPEPGYLKTFWMRVTRQ